MGASSMMAKGGCAVFHKTLSLIRENILEHIQPITENRRTVTDLRPYAPSVVWVGSKLYFVYGGPSIYTANMKDTAQDITETLQIDHSELMTWGWVPIIAYYSNHLYYVWAQNDDPFNRDNPFDIYFASSDMDGSNFSYSIVDTFPNTVNSGIGGFSLEIDSGVAYIVGTATTAYEVSKVYFGRCNLDGSSFVSMFLTPDEDRYLVSSFVIYDSTIFIAMSHEVSGYWHVIIGTSSLDGSDFSTTQLTTGSFDNMDCQLQILDSVIYYAWRKIVMSGSYMYSQIFTAETDLSYSGFSPIQQTFYTDGMARTFVFKISATSRFIACFHTYGYNSSGEFLLYKKVENSSGYGLIGSSNIDVNSQGLSLVVQNDKAIMIPTSGYMIIYTYGVTYLDLIQRDKGAVWQDNDLAVPIFFEESFVEILPSGGHVFTALQWVKLSNGTFLATYTDWTEKGVYLFTFDSEDDILTTHDYAVGKGTLFGVFHGSMRASTFNTGRMSSLFVTASGRLLLFIYETEGALVPPNGGYVRVWTDVYVSPNGLGTDFEFLTNVQYSDEAGSDWTSLIFGGYSSDIGLATQLDSGDIMIPVPCSITGTIFDEDYMQIFSGIATSTDDGDTWSYSTLDVPFVPPATDTLAFAANTKPTLGIGKCSGGTITTLCRGRNNYYSYIFQDGSNYDNYGNFGPVAMFDGKDGKTYVWWWSPTGYDSAHVQVYWRYADAIFPTDGDPYSIGVGKTWQTGMDFTIGTNPGLIFRADATSKLVYSVGLYGSSVCDMERITYTAVTQRINLG